METPSGSEIVDRIRERFLSGDDVARRDPAETRGYWKGFLKGWDGTNKKFIASIAVCETCPEVFQVGPRGGDPCGYLLKHRHDFHESINMQMVQSTKNLREKDRRQKISALITEIFDLLAPDAGQHQYMKKPDQRSQLEFVLERLSKIPPPLLHYLTEPDAFVKNSQSALFRELLAIIEPMYNTVSRLAKQPFQEREILTSTPGGAHVSRYPAPSTMPMGWARSDVVRFQLVKYQTIHSIPDGLIVYADLKISLVNGYTPAEVIGKSPFEFFIHPDDREYTMVAQQRTLNAGQQGSVCYRIIKDGKITYQQSFGKLIDDRHFELYSIKIEEAQYLAFRQEVPGIQSVPSIGGAAPTVNLGGTTSAERDFIPNTLRNTARCCTGNVESCWPLASADNVFQPPSMNELDLMNCGSVLNSIVSSNDVIIDGVSQQCCDVNMDDSGIEMMNRSLMENIDFDLLREAEFNTFL